MASLVVGDATHSLVREINHLVLPEFAADSPAVDEDDSLPESPVAVKQGSVIGCLNKCGRQIPGRWPFHLRALREDLFPVNSQHPRTGSDNGRQKISSVHKPYPCTQEYVVLKSYCISRRFCRKRYFRRSRCAAITSHVMELPARWWYLEPRNGKLFDPNGGKSAARMATAPATQSTRPFLRRRNLFETLEFSRNRPFIAQSRNDPPPRGTAEDSPSRTQCSADCWRIRAHVF